MVQLQELSLVRMSSCISARGLRHSGVHSYVRWSSPVSLPRLQAQEIKGCRLDTTPARLRPTFTRLASDRIHSDQRYANHTSRSRPPRDSTSTVVLLAVPPRYRLCRPRHAARPDPRTMRSASIASSAGGPRWCWVRLVDHPYNGA